jgi:hypothetical protein
MRMPARFVGLVPPSNVTRPLAVAPLDVTITTFETSSPLTVTGSDPVSESPPSGPPTRMLTVMLSPDPVVLICIPRVCSV